MKKYTFFATFLAVLSLPACSPYRQVSVFRLPSPKHRRPCLPRQPIQLILHFQPTRLFLPRRTRQRSLSSESFSIRLFPGIEASLIYAIETGTEIWLDFPKDATLQPARVMLIPGLSSMYPPTLVYNGDAFDLLTGLGDQMEGFKRFTLNAPVSVTIKFAGPQNLETLALYNWTGSDWVKVDTACNFHLPVVDTGTNSLSTSICSLGSFAIFARNGD